MRIIIVMKKIIKDIMLLPSKLYNFILLYKKHVKVGKQVNIRGRIRIMGNGKIEIGDGTVINSSVLANPVGGQKQTVFYVINESKLNIGKNSGISNSIICCSNEITIGDNVKIGGGCGVYDNDFHSLDYIERRQIHESSIKSAPIIIGNDVFIGANCLILKGIEIGARSIIGAGSVLTKSVPEDEIWAGNPAKFIKKIDRHNL
jgi:acetyltransferase-like isoleucine patch superfamily enzyme